MAKNKFEQHMPFMVIVSLVAIVAIVTLVLQGNSTIEGATFFEKEDLEPFQDKCIDDDPENDFYVAGTTKLGVNTYIDHCEDNDLHQHYCKNGRDVKHTRHYPCPNGCNNGVCLR